jgi:hypothetical protein
MQRFDYVFSYWLFAWYLLYVVGLVPFNPLPFLIGAGIINVAELLFGFVDDSMMFIFINVFIKVIPLYTLRHTTVNTADYTAGLVYVLLWMTWMNMNNQDIIKIRTPFKDTLTYLFNGKKENTVGP